MNIWLIVVIAMMCIEMGFILYHFTKRKKVLGILTEYLLAGNYDQYDQVLVKNRRLFPQYNFTHLQFQKDLCVENNNAISKDIEIMEKSAVNEKQKSSVYAEAFQYYMDHDLYSEAEVIEKKVNSLKNEQLKFFVNCTYDCIAAGGHQFEKELLNRLKEEKYQSQWGYYNLMLSYVYLNLNDQEKASEYKKLSEQQVH